MSRTVISVEALGKQYVIGARENSSDSFREMVVSAAAAPFRRLKRLSGQVSSEERIWALKDVSFEVKEGEVVGIIGRNGAGKSTLLKVLSRITAPTMGRVEIRGRVSSLLEVGTGFHPELTGRENIYLNGAILGMSRVEINSRFNDIVDFSGVAMFLDTPVKRYSSGMLVRLAFAVAAHLDPEVLIIDEVLAVGDAEFQNKCLGKMQEVAHGGRTILVVSHNMPMIQHLCGRAVVLAEGSIAYDGNVNDSIQHYLGDDGGNHDSTLKERTDRLGDGRLRFVDASVVGAAKNVVRMGEKIQIIMTYEAFAILNTCDVSIHVDDAWGHTLLRLATRETTVPFSIQPGRANVICTIPYLQLLPGRYSLVIAASIPPAYEYLDHISHAAFFEVVPDDVNGTGKVPECGVFFTRCAWSVEALQEVDTRVPTA